MKYPLPSYAGSTWLAGDHLFLSMPGAEDHIQSHVVQVEVDLAALRNMLSIESLSTVERKTIRSLYAFVNTLRERSLANAPQKISHPSAPTQWDLDIVMKALASGSKVTRIAPKKSAPENLQLEDLDL